MKKIEFKELSYDDIEDVRNWRNSVHVSRYMYTDNYISKTEQINWFNRINNCLYSKYWIIIFNNEKIGLINITKINLDQKSCYWAFYIGVEKYREIGASVIAEFLFLDKLFFELEFECIFCEVLINNTTVISLHKKFGFKIINNEKFYIKKNNINQEFCRLVLQKNEFLLIRDKLKQIILK